MKNGFYESRKEQMQAMRRRFIRNGGSLSELLKSACECGAAEERSRILALVEDWRLRDLICRKSVSEVLGYKRK